VTARDKSSIGLVVRVVCTVILPVVGSVVWGGSSDVALILY
jgi:hypothetical protein